MWLFLWVMIVLGALGFFLWSYHELFEQKRLWKGFASKNGLSYAAGRVLDSPSMSGQLKGRTVNFYPQNVENMQGHQSILSVIEVFLNDVPETTCLVASTGFADFVSSVDLPEPFDVDDNNWPKGILARSFEEDRPQDWFAANPDRVLAISKLSNMPFHVAFVADGDQAFIAIRTGNPLNDERKLNKLLSKLYEIATMLETAPWVAPEKQEITTSPDAV